MEKQITAVLKKLEYGVYIVTMGQGNAGNAFTASWVSQVSNEPPIIALAVHNKHQSSRQIDQAGSNAEAAMHRAVQDKRDPNAKP